ncbi:MAG: hypothetical protein FE048_03500 [Thermoplasmata archaeon]|nr:MAG: hypothetical protein FE048_03500 [Thermoplasmata archaeon]
MEKRVILIGVGHVFDISQQIKDIIEYVKPDIIALELDDKRMQALLSPKFEKDVPLFYKLLGKVQENIAKKYGVKTGSEMMAGIQKARELGIPTICIDMDAQSVFVKLWKYMPLRKKISLIFGGFATLLFSKNRVEKEVELFEKNADEYLFHFEKYFPNVKKILIDERNEYMASRLKVYLEEYPTIIAIVGEGHILGLKNMLQEHASLTLIHLTDLREGKWKEKILQTNPI